MRFYFGGYGSEDWRLPEAELVGRSLDALEAVTGHRPAPLWHRTFRWKDGFAQPNLGHFERHRALEASAVPGLALAGGYFTGVGIPDCLARAQAAADEIDRYLQNRHTEPTIGAISS